MGIERKLASLEKRMNELCKKNGVTIERSREISTQECEQAINIVMSKLERIDQSIANEYNNFGLERNKSEQKLLKDVTLEDVVDAQESAYNRVIGVVEQARKLGLFALVGQKAMKELFNRYDHILRRVELLDAKMGDIVKTC